MHIRTHGFGLAIAIALYAAPAPAMDHVWIVGGGDDPQSSQAQIEQNVIWARKAIAGIPGTRRISVFFTDGDAPGKDVKVWEPRADGKDDLHPFTRVFAGEHAIGEYYRNHAIPGVIAGTEAGALRERLGRDFDALKAGDRALFIFNGHGGHDRKDTANNTIQLWNRTSLTVRDMEVLFSRIDPAVPARFVFTQCFSGGFARLLRAGATADGALSPALRCGFMAEAEDRLAEGCSAGIDANDYRDYSTYFFAALSGRTRQGQALPANPDRDGDGAVSLYEAHLFVLRTAQSTDLPRSTSEDFLEHWSPGVWGWARRLQSTSAPLDARANPYGRLAEELAAELELPVEKAARRREIENRKKANDDEHTAQREERKRLTREATTLKRELQRDVALHWPEVRVPHTEAYREFLSRDRAAARDFILAHEHYAGLVEKQARLAVLAEANLNNARRYTRLELVERLDTLDRKRRRFEAMASDTDKSDYSRLRACEEQGL